jgi:hypothetical protein
MLIASHVTKGHAADTPSCDSLKIKRPAASTEDLDLIASSPNQQHGPLGQKDLVFIPTWPHKDLIVRSGIL